MRSSRRSGAAVVSGIFALVGLASCALVLDYSAYEGKVVTCRDDSAVTPCVGPACGRALWSKRYGDSDFQALRRVAVGADCSILVAGDYIGSFKIGEKPVGPMNTADIIAAKLDPQGEPIWVKDRFTKTGIYVRPHTGYGIAPRPDGGAVIVGGFDNTAMGMNTDGYAMQLDADGVEAWVKPFGETNVDGAVDVAVDASDDAYVVGSVSGDIQVIKYDPQGAVMWEKTLGGQADDFGWGVALAPDGVVLAGRYQGFWGGLPDRTVPLTNTAFVMKLTTGGNPGWAQPIIAEAPAVSEAFDVATDKDGNILVAGTTSGSTTFGSTNPVVMQSTQGGGNGDAFLVKLDPSGNVVWARVFGDLQEQGGNGVAVAEDGSIFLTGSFFGKIDFGSGASVTSDSMKSMFIAKFNPLGEHVWSAHFGAGATSMDPGWIVPATSKNTVVIAGYWASDLDFGNGALKAQGNLDAFVAKFSQ